MEQSVSAGPPTAAWRCMTNVAGRTLAKGTKEAGKEERREGGTKAGERRASLLPLEDAGNSASGAGFHWAGVSGLGPSAPAGIWHIYTGLYFMPDRVRSFSVMVTHGSQLHGKSSGIKVNAKDK